MKPEAAGEVILITATLVVGEDTDIILTAIR